MPDENREPEVAHLFLEKYDEYRTRMTPYITLMQIQLKAAGIDMTEVDCWSYMSWCGEQLQNNITASLNEQGRTAIQQMARLVAETCSKSHRATRTGKLSPPGLYEKHWDTVEDYNAEYAAFRAARGGSGAGLPSPVPQPTSDRGYGTYL